MHNCTVQFWATVWNFPVYQEVTEVGSPFHMLVADICSINSTTFAPTNKNKCTQCLPNSSAIPRAPSGFVATLYNGTAMSKSLNKSIAWCSCILKCRRGMVVFIADRHGEARVTWCTKPQTSVDRENRVCCQIFNRLQWQNCTKALLAQISLLLTLTLTISLSSVEYLVLNKWHRHWCFSMVGGT